MLKWYARIDEMIMTYRASDKELNYFEYKGYRYKKTKIHQFASFCYNKWFIILLVYLVFRPLGWLAYLIFGFMIVDIVPAILFSIVSKRDKTY